MIQVLQGRPVPGLVAAADWMNGRSQRERVLIVAMAGLAVIAIGWYGVARPILSARADDTQRIALYETLKTRLASTPPGAVVTVRQPAIEGALVDVVRARASGLGLAGEIAGDEAAATVALRNARFDAVANLLAVLEASDGAAIDQVRMTAAGSPGLVDLTLRVSR